MENSDETKQFEKNQFLLQMQGDINNLQEIIKLEIKNNSRKRKIRNLKVSFNFFRLLAPYLLSTCVLTAGFKLIKNDAINPPYYVMKQIDNNGKIFTSQVINTQENILYYYSNWEEKNGLYCRIIKTYSLDNLLEEDINTILKTDNINLNDILGLPISYKEERKSQLSNSEKNSPEYLQAVIYVMDEENEQIKKEQIKIIINNNIAYIMITLTVNFSIYLIRKKFFKYSFMNSLYEIIDNYEEVDVDDLRKKLEIRKDNYERLVR